MEKNDVFKEFVNTCVVNERSLLTSDDSLFTKENLLETCNFLNPTLTL